MTTRPSLQPSGLGSFVALTCLLALGMFRAVSAQAVDIGRHPDGCAVEAHEYIGVHVVAPTLEDASQALRALRPDQWKWIDITFTGRHDPCPDAVWAWLVVSVADREYMRIPADAPPPGASRTVRIGLPLGLGIEP